MKQWSYSKKSNKLILKAIGYFVVLIITLVAIKITKVDKQEIEEFKLIAIRQKSGKIRYYKKVGKTMINIDKLTLEDLMNRYDIVLEEIPNEK